jgi:pyruvate/2-oxoglutarate/acetoin dehydrogenase E1 component
MHIPGIKVVMPTTPDDAKGLLLASIFDPNPVLMIEHRLLYDIPGEVPDGYYEIPFGRASTRRVGRDLTIVANSYMVVECLKAAEYLEGHGIDVEIIDPVTLVPFDQEAVLGSVRKTGRLLVVDTSWVTCGVSAEVAALAAERAFFELRQPIRRIGMQPVTCPVSKPLENAFYPNAKSIASEIFAMLGRDLPDVEVPMLTNNFKGPF